ncbi:hypothetical protein ABZZ47_12440 [Streptomyces sp. NPDC006465]|uniref:hypothetical protein n=1 Tax=Streptomyces sp. NPDC006465 TaxID=3157174 RepID=UPI0033BB8C16
MRSNLHGTAGQVDLRRGRLAQVQPGAYRQQLHAGIGQARRTATGRIRGRHLAVLRGGIPSSEPDKESSISRRGAENCLLVTLDAAREDLGGPNSTPTTQLPHPAAV